MKKELENILFDKYRFLYRDLAYLSCNDGWFNLIDELSAKLEYEIKMIIEHDSFLCVCEHRCDDHMFGTGVCAECECRSFTTNHPAATQVKEKFGTLRFYMNYTTKEIDDLINDAEHRSCVICESCGSAGTLCGREWVSVLCKECNEAHEKMLNSR